MVYISLNCRQIENSTEKLEIMLPNGSSWEENLCLNLGLGHSPSTPTPPQSPELGYETSFSNVDLVDPNAVLDESHLMLDPAGLNFHSPLPNSSEENIKTECWSPLAYSGSSCKNEIFNESFRESLSPITKTEIRNDCMWTSGSENIKLDKLPTSKTNDESAKFCISRSRLDSVPSKYSEIFDPLNNIMSLISSDDPASQNILLNTPADTSDTDSDTDLEDTCTLAENIHLEHNYHFSNNRISSKFPCDFQKSFNEQVSERQQIHSADCSDEEVTVDEGSEDSDSSCDTLRNYPQIANHSLLTFKNSKENVIINTNFNVDDLQMFRKTYTPRKVGRPSKNPKRLENSLAKNRRTSFRSSQMDPEKRKAHNSMERIRRVNLKSDFENIRSLVPSLIDRTRAPKVLILRSAVEFVCELNDEIKKLDSELQTLSRHNNILKQKYEELKEKRGKKEIEFG